MGAVTVSDLQGWQLFSYLPAADLARLANIATQDAYRAGDYLFREGEPGDAFWVLLRGQVKIFKVSPEAREQILRIVYPGEAFAEAAALSEGPFPANAQATTRAVVVRFPAAAFQQALQENPRLALNVIVALSHLLRGFTALVDALALREVSARVAKYLLDLALRSEGEWVTLDVNKRALAARLGTVSETLSRTLRRLREEGIIEVEGPRIRILSRAALERAAAGLKA